MIKNIIAIHCINWFLFMNVKIYKVTQMTC